MSQPAHQTNNAGAERDNVNDALTAHGATRSTPSRPAARRGAARRRRRGEVENTDYAAFPARVIRAHARRIAEGDVDGLADLLALRDELDAATQVAVTGLRGFGYSWGEIASRLGTTRQAAQQRWGR
jgi:DNA-directed RNA polymerase specialized sigma24 family protein